MTGKNGLRLINKYSLKDIIDDILNENEVPAGVKDKLMHSAKLYLLAKDLGLLFTKAAPTSAADIMSTVSKSKNKPNPNHDEQA